jgi:hypothetical protein
MPAVVLRPTPGSSARHNCKPNQARNSHGSAGTLDVLEHTWNILKAKPLGDPHVRNGF